MKVYRVMKVGPGGKPLVGTRGSMLGVRPTDPNSADPKQVFDVAAVTDADAVRPGEGLSTSTDPNFRRPRRGEAVFTIETDDLAGTDVNPNQDSPTHVLLEPSASMPLGDFQQALKDTKELWEQVQ